MGLFEQQQQQLQLPWLRRLLSLDSAQPTEWKVYQVLVSGLVFGVLECVLRVTCARLFKYLLRHNSKLSPAQRAAVAEQSMSRMVGFLHNALQLPLAVLVLTDPVILADPIHATTDLSQLLMLVSAGFFLYDAIVSGWRFSMEGPLYLMHACFCCTVYTYAAINGIVHFYGAGFLMWECSTACVHIRWYLYKMGLERSLLYFGNALLMILTFFLCRIVWGAWLSLQFFRNAWQQAHMAPGQRPPLPVIVLFSTVCVTLNCLNLYWFSKMVQKGMSFYVHKQEVHSEKDE